MKEEKRKQQVDNIIHQSVTNRHTLFLNNYSIKVKRCLFTIFLKCVREDAVLQMTGSLFHRLGP